MLICPEACLGNFELFYLRVETQSNDIYVMPEGILWKPQCRQAQTILPQVSTWGLYLKMLKIIQNEFVFLFNPKH